jgi:hypothetical protein
VSEGSFRPATESDVSTLLQLMRALYDEDGSTPLREDSAETALRGLLAARAHALYRRSGFAERGLRLMTKRLGIVPVPR